MIRTSGVKFQDPKLNIELEHIVRQVNTQLKTVANPVRKYSIQASGLVNGINKIFTLPDNFDTSTIIVYIDSTRQMSGYTLSDKRIIFDTAPSSGTVRADYTVKS